MRYPAARRRIPLKQLPLRLHFVTPAPGVFGVDVGEALAQLELRELLRQAGVRGKV